MRGYDPERGTAFSTYAWVAIYRQIHQRVKEVEREESGGAVEVALPQPTGDPEARMEQLVVQHALCALVDRLPERLQRVIVCRYGLGEQEPCTLKQVGAELELTGERVRQLQQVYTLHLGSYYLEFENKSFGRHKSRSVVEVER